MSLSDVMSLILMHHNWNYNDALEWKTFGLPKIFVTAFFMACVEISKNKRGGGVISPQPIKHFTIQDQR